MKIALLIAEVLFIVFMIRRNFKRIENNKHRFYLKRTRQLAISICFVNFIIIVGGINGLGYIPDMVFLVPVIIELLFGNLY